MNRAQTIQAIFGNMGTVRRFMQQKHQFGFNHADLSPAQYETLVTLYHNQPLSHKALAGYMQLTPGALSQLLDGLDQAQCIVRNASPSDRRVSYLEVSRHGKQMLEQLNKQREQFFTEIFTVMSDQELEVYLQVQQKMIDWFEAHQLATQKNKEMI